MTETSDIDDAIDVLVALNLDSLSDAQAEYDQLVVISGLITALTDGDINGYNEATARTALILARDAIESLIDLKTANWVKKFQS